MVEKNVVGSPMAFFHDRFTHADPELLARRTLQKRVDTKFICRAHALDTLVAPLESHFHAAVSGRYVHAPYRTVYWDTPERKSLFDHHRGKRPRFKVRIRHHIGRELSSLEVKSNRGQGNTSKNRFPLPYPCEDLAPEQLEEALTSHAFAPSHTLRPSMVIEFNRTTLVGVAIEERMTIDTDLIFRDEQREYELPELAIVEVKQAKWNHQSPSMQLLRRNKIRELGISKYLTGAQFLWPHLKLNRHRQNVREIRRVLSAKENQQWSN